MASKEVILKRMQRMDTIKSALKQNPEIDLKEFMFQVANDFKICLRTAKEDVLMASWEAKNEN